MKLIFAPVDAATQRVDVSAVAAAMTRNTIGIVGSAVTFPHGALDDIPALGALAAAAGVPLHVDSCLGSFLITVAAEAGYPLRVPFDFAVPGVASISADPHKYGFTPKGTSIVMYANPALRHAQYFAALEWPGGIYASPTIAGSRSGAVTAAAWATMMHLGRSGYVESAKQILGAAAAIRAGLAAVPGVALVGAPELSVVAFVTVGPARANIYALSDAMGSRGWHLATLQYPAALHICVTLANASVAAASFVPDVIASLAEVAAAPPGKYDEGSGAIYGLAAALPDKALIGDVTHAFLDALYKA